MSGFLAKHLLCAFNRINSIHIKTSQRLQASAYYRYSYSSMASEKIKQPLVWVDLEMTGLNVTQDKILEIACLVTDGDLNIVSEGPNLIIHQEDSVLDNMDPWCIDQHGKTGLTKACRESKISEQEAEDQVMEFLQKHVSQGESPLAGNTIHMDRKFLAQYMPKIHNYLHYRLVDVSSVKELVKRWYPDVHTNAPPKNFTHRALDDIRASVEELKYYRKTVFKPTI